MITKQLKQIRDKHQAIVNACNIILSEHPAEPVSSSIKHKKVLKAIGKKPWTKTAKGRKIISQQMKAYWRKKKGDNQ